MDPITELSNDISADIDLTDATGILSILHQCDSQVFTGWQMHQSIYHPSIIGAIENVSKLAVKMLKNARGGIVFSGCGTSGRLAFLSAVGYSNHFPDKVVSYTIAGGDKALFMSVEAPEDSWRDGVNDLEKITKDLDFVLFIGITCGLSAPYVAGQLDYCLQHLDKYIPVLLGFNPVSLARKNNIDNWDKTFHDVAVAMEKLSCDGGPCYIINPIVGPEAITGSSRMKSGTATKMILDAMFVMTFKQFHNLPMPKCSIPNIFSCYELTYRFTYLSSESISKLIDAAAKSLCAGGRVCYIGQDRLGIMSAIDASECPPTYGADINDIRCFIKGGWNNLKNREGLIESTFNLDWEYFKSDVLPVLSDKDTVVFIGAESTELLEFIQPKNCTTAIINITDANTDDKILEHSNVDMCVSVKLPFEAIKVLCGVDDNFLSFFTEMSLKWCLNAVSTGAHIAKGKILSNKMIDVQVSNTKLYYRAIRIIQDFCHVEKEIAESHLLNSIYNDKIPKSCDIGILHHIKTSTKQPLVVPTAILMVKSKISCTEARDWLSQQPVLRKALKMI